MCYSQYPLPASSTGPTDQEMLQGPLACQVSSNGLQEENNGLGSCDYFSEGGFRLADVGLPYTGYIRCC